jgi:hypothetical protein
MWRLEVLVLEDWLEVLLETVEAMVAMEAMEAIAKRIWCMPRTAMSSRAT